MPCWLCCYLKPAQPLSSGGERSWLGGGLVSFSQHSCDTAAEEIKMGAAECSPDYLLLPVYPLCLSGQKLNSFYSSSRKEVFSPSYHFAALLVIFLFWNLQQGRGCWDEICLIYDTFPPAISHLAHCSLSAPTEISLIPWGGNCKSYFEWKSHLNDSPQYMEKEEEEILKPFDSIWKIGFIAAVFFKSDCFISCGCLWSKEKSIVKPTIFYSFL